MAYTQGSGDTYGAISGLNGVDAFRKNHNDLYNNEFLKQGLDPSAGIGALAPETQSAAEGYYNNSGATVSNTFGNKVGFTNPSILGRDGEKIGGGGLNLGGIGSLAGGISSIAQLFLGFKQLGLGEEQLRLNKSAYDTTLSNRTSEYNRQLEGQAKFDSEVRGNSTAGKTAGGAEVDQEAIDYIKKYTLNN